VPIGTYCRLCGCARAVAAICGWLCQIRAQVCGCAGLSTGIAVFCHRRIQPGPRRLLVASGQSRRLFNTPLGFALLAGDALGVDPQQHVHAVPRPFGNLRSRNSGVEPGRDGGVAQVIGPAQERDAEQESRIQDDILSSHSSHFLRVLQPTLRTGTEALTTAALAWLAPPSGS
jgi:hypothetical protein